MGLKLQKKVVEECLLHGILRPKAIVRFFDRHKITPSRIIQITNYKVTKELNFMGNARR